MKMSNLAGSLKMALLAAEMDSSQVLVVSETKAVNSFWMGL